MTGAEPRLSRGEGVQRWRTQLLALLDVARLGNQFPDAMKWRALLELLGREGLKGQPVDLEISELTGLPTPKALAKLHSLQLVARDFFKTYRTQPVKDAKAFSMALAALELPPVTDTQVRLVTKARVSRFVITHERLELCAVRFSITVDQHSGGHLVLGKDQLARVSEKFGKLLERACEDSALAAHRVLEQARGLEVIEVLRGQLGPFVSGLLPVPEVMTVELRELRPLVKDASSAVLSVQLERLGKDVAKTSLNDPWLGDEPPVPGKQVARERRLFCTAELEASVKALVAKTGKPVLVRSR